MPALSTLTNTATLVGTDEFYVLDGGNSRAISFTSLLDNIEASGAAPASFISSGTFDDARIAASNVTQHQAALSITESQISDLGAYITGITAEPLSDLSDVTITSILSGEVLVWNGAAWVNNTLSEAGIQPAGSYLTDITAEPLSDLSDVTISSILSGELLVWNGSAWVNNTLAEAGIQPAGSYLTDITGESLGSLSDVTITSILANEVLKWNGSAWVNNTLAEAGIQPAPAEGPFVDTDKTKLDGIEELADVTDTANVTAAGALMDSELTDLAGVKALDTSTLALLAGSTFTGIVQFSGTDHEGLRLNSLTTAQRDALTPVNGMVIFNSTTGNIEGYDGSWTNLGAAGGTGDSWSTPVDSDILPTGASDTYDLGSTSAVFAQGHISDIFTDSILLTERADHVNTFPNAGKAELWVSNDATQKLNFTDDAGTDKEVAFITGGTDFSGYTGLLGLNSGTAVDVTTSALLAARLTDETGTGALVFATGPLLSAPSITSPTLTAPEINDTSSDHQYIFGVSELTADRTVTLPLLTGNDTFVFEAHAATLTNKTIDSANNTITVDLGEATVTGTTAQFNTALSDDSFAVLSGNTFTGLQQFSGTGHAGLRLNSLTTTQRDLLTPAAGDIIFNTTTGNVEGYNGTGWDDLTQGGGTGTVDTSGTPVLNDFARFTDADTIEGRSYAEVRADLSLVVGSDVQAWDEQLDDIAALAVTDGNFIVGNGTNWVAESGATARASMGAAATSGDLSQFAATTSAQLAGVISDETGSGALVFGTSPTIVTPALTLANSAGASPTTLAVIEFDSTADQIVVGDGVGTKTFSDDSKVALVANNLSDLANAATARTNLSAQTQGDVLDDINTLGAATAGDQFLVSTDAGVLAWESGATARASLGAEAADADILKADTADQLTAGYSAAIHDLGTPAASSTVTLDDANGNYQKLTNDDNFTLEPPALAANEATSFVIHVTNSATTPGTITFGTTNGGFETPTGDTVPTTANAVFFLYITCSDNGTAQKNTVVVKEMA